MSKVRLYGSTSGYVELEAPAVSPDATLTLPPTFAGIGTNVVQTVKTDAFTTTSTSYTAVTGLTVTITPTSANSKILLLAQVSLSGDNGRGDVRISGGNATNYVDASGAAFSWIGRNSSVLDLERTLLPSNLMYLDSPATTSATTYTVEVKTVAASDIRVNGTGVGDTAGTSSLTAIEVAA